MSHLFNPQKICLSFLKLSYNPLMFYLCPYTQYLSFFVLNTLFYCMHKFADSFHAVYDLLLTINIWFFRGEQGFVFYLYKIYSRLLYRIAISVPFPLPTPLNTWNITITTLLMSLYNNCIISCSVTIACFCSLLCHSFSFSVRQIMLEDRNYECYLTQFLFLQS